MVAMAYQTYSRLPKRQTKKSRRLLLLIPLLLLAVAAYWLIWGRNTANAPDTSQQTQQSADTQPEVPAYTPINLQPVVEAWEAPQAAKYSIVVYDVQAKKDIASVNADDVLFAASLYKQYVAYLSLLDIQNGDMNADEPLTGGFTRIQCIDKMIRESHSPCGEAMMADIGQSTLNQRVEDLGMTGTYFNGIRTSARDSALILRHIVDRKDLNEENTALLLDAMRTQDAKFKRGLATGAPEAIWETKVGWNEDANYHDIGIMTLPDGRKFVVAILGQGSGSSKPIADFAATIYAALTQ